MNHRCVASLTAHRNITSYAGCILSDPPAAAGPQDLKNVRSVRSQPAPSALAIVIALVWLAPVFAGQDQKSNTSARSRPAPGVKTWRVPRTRNGRPDLQGVWNFSTLTPMERPAALAGKAYLTVQEAAAYEKREAERRSKPNPRDAAELAEDPDFGAGAEAPVAYDFRTWWDRGSKVVSTRRTSLVVDPPDGRIPPLTLEGQKRVAAQAEARRRPAAGPEDRSVVDRCIVGINSGPPMTSSTYMNNMQLFQSPGYVVIVTEMIHAARIIPTDGRPHGTVRRWQGDSRGRWEGDTLVVDTINFFGTTSFRGSSPNLHLVERFARVDRYTLMYEYTIDDPATWTKPWTVEHPMVKTEGPLYEYACHEGNHSMIGILGAARAEEKAAEEAAKKKRSR